jgi:AcrR family transcriptional regulator
MTKAQQLIDSIRKIPSQRRAEETIETLFEAAAQLLQSEQESKISTNKIAARAGFSIGTLYQYFPNKESLLVHLARYERDQITRKIKIAIDGADNIPLEDIIRRIVKILLQAFSGRQKMRKRLIIGLLKLENITPFVTAQNELIDFIVSEIGRVSRADIRPLDDVSIFVMSRSLIGTIRSAVMEESDVLLLPTFEDELVRLVQGYLQPQ